MKKRLILNMLVFFVALGIFSSSALYAQDEELPTTQITGKVLAQDGQGISNVLISSFLSKDETMTDAGGNFTITVASLGSDQLVMQKEGFQFKVVELSEGDVDEEELVMIENDIFQNQDVSLPYQTLSANRNVSAINTLSGDDLRSYPANSFLESLIGRVPGLSVGSSSNKPGFENFYVSIRGVQAKIYIDGIEREATDISVYEVESVQVLKDFSSRAALGITGVNPVLWITTKIGKSYNKNISVSAEYGFSSPTSLPKMLPSYQYAMLYNEALANDGQDPLYSNEELEAYRTGNDPLYYPNVDYYDRYVKSSTPYRRANITFSGGDARVNYFSLLDYVGSEGLEAVGQQTNSDRFKLRGGANIKLNDFIQMNVNLSGTYGNQKYPNTGSGAGTYDMFNILSNYPSNAHAIYFQDSLLLTSDNYPINLDNDLKYSGYAAAVNLNTQNNASLIVDLNSVLEGLSFKGKAAFDIYSNMTNSKGGTAALYRLLPDNQVERIQEEVVETGLNLGNDDFTRRTVGSMQFDYVRTFGPHALNMNAIYFQGLTESRVRVGNYQPEKKQDFSYRANYSFDNRYTVQLDLTYSGSMRMPVGEQFGLYPTIGAAWIASNESFLSSAGGLDFLKFFSSFGIMGNDDFRMNWSGDLDAFSTYNPYYLYRTLWQNIGGWSSGIPGNSGSDGSLYAIQQQGSSNYSLPKRSYFNLGMQTEFLDRLFSVELNYFYQKDYNQLSQNFGKTPTLFGTGGFLPVSNYGSSNVWGFDGLIQIKDNFGDFYYTLGANFSYLRSKYLDVDEPVALDDYLKRSGKEADLLWLYNSEGLYQSAEEITERNISQSWGTVQPGDIRYTDYNNDGIVDEKDRYSTDIHSPRLHYGLNLTLKYKNLGLFVSGAGVANGETVFGQSLYVNSTQRNYSEIMLDRYPISNDLPRLTTQSQNNSQGSTFWLVNGAYFSLKSVEISYSLPYTVAQKIAMRNCTLFARGKNLLSVSELKQKYDVDPESPTAGYYGYPLYRTFSFGVSCKF